MATVTFTGGVGSVDLRFTAAGKPVCDVSVAENHRKKDQQGNWIDDTPTWRRISFWEEHAEAVAESIQKGQIVIVTGDERLVEYTTQSGTSGKSLEVRGRDIGVLVIPKKKQQQSGNPGQSDSWGQSNTQSAWTGGAYNASGTEAPF